MPCKYKEGHSNHQMNTYFKTEVLNEKFTAHERFLDREISCQVNPCQAKFLLQINLWPRKVSLGRRKFSSWDMFPGLRHRFLERVFQIVRLFRMARN